MTLPAWCGHCGESFDTAEILEPADGAASPSVGAAAGHCPRCGIALAPGYLPVLVTATRSLLVALDAATAAAAQLRDVAPALHIDHRAAAELLRGALEHGRDR